MDKVVPIRKKICLLGSYAVGKTSTVERFVFSRFDDKYLSTIGVKVSQKILSPIPIDDTGRFKQFNLLIWDIEGIEKFDKKAKIYYKGAAGAIAVADMTRPESIEDLYEISDQFLSVNPLAQLVVLGNKVDIFDRDKNTLNKLKETAEKISGDYLLTSAKTGEQVEDAFMLLAKKLGRAHE